MHFFNFPNLWGGDFICQNEVTFLISRILLSIPSSAQIPSTYIPP